MLDILWWVNYYNKQVNTMLHHLAGRLPEADKGSADIYFYTIVLCNEDSQILQKNPAKFHY